jgi:hypothetical protein
MDIESFQKVQNNIVSEKGIKKAAAPKGQRLF